MTAIKWKCVYPLLRQAVNDKLIPVVVGKNITDQRCCYCKSCLIVAVWYTFIQTVKSNKLGSLSNDDGDVNENGEKATSWFRLAKTTTLHLHYAFLCVSLPSLHDCDGKKPNFTFCGEREHKTTTLYFCPELRYSPLELTQGKIANIDKLNEME